MPCSGTRKVPAGEVIDAGLAYNPQYGYSRKNLIIFSPGAPFDLNIIWGKLDFPWVFRKRYSKMRDMLDEQEYDEACQPGYTSTGLF